MREDRRRFLLAAGGLGVTGLPAARLQGASDEARTDHVEAPVTAPEDLMREHGVLRRLLLVYEEGLRRLAAQRKEVAPDSFHGAASLVRKFVEEYHEVLEEKFIFPEFERRGTLVDLVRTLRRQHQAGRALTREILRDSEPGRFGDVGARRELARACRAFIRMYRPHAAREDTVLFPALGELLSAEALHELGERFEEQEDRLFGEGGFHKTVEQVAAIEKRLGIYDLAQFTPGGAE
jgi:hemerythrin-like domain-containing protein